MPNEMIKIGTSYMADAMEVNTVNARELWAGLGVLRQYADWIKDQVNRARLVEGRDFITVHEKVNRQILKEYFLTIDAAKHVAMMSNTEKGFDVRDYFIEFEKRHSVPVDPLTQLANAVLLSQKIIAEKNTQIEHLEKTKAWIADKKTATACGKLGGTTKALNAAKVKLSKLEKINELRAEFKPFKSKRNGESCAHCFFNIKFGDSIYGQTPKYSKGPWGDMVHSGCFEAYLSDRVSEDAFDKAVAKLNL